MNNNIDKLLYNFYDYVRGFSRETRRTRESETNVIMNNILMTDEENLIRLLNSRTENIFLNWLMKDSAECKKYLSFGYIQSQASKKLIDFHDELRLSNIKYCLDLIECLRAYLGSKVVYNYNLEINDSYELILNVNDINKLRIQCKFLEKECKNLISEFNSDISGILRYFINVSTDIVSINSSVNIPKYLFMFVDRDKLSSDPKVIAEANGEKLPLYTMIKLIENKITGSINKINEIGESIYSNISYVNPNEYFNIFIDKYMDYLDRDSLIFSQGTDLLLFENFLLKFHKDDPISELVTKSQVKNTYLEFYKHINVSIELSPDRKLILFVALVNIYSPLLSFDLEYVETMDYEPFRIFDLLVSSNGFEFLSHIEVSDEKLTDESTIKIQNIGDSIKNWRSYLQFVLDSTNMEYIPDSIKKKRTLLSDLLR